MTRFTHSARAAVSPAEKRVRGSIRLALVQVMADLGASQNQIARWVKRHPQTVASWLREDTAVSVEATFASKQIGERFRRALCSYAHEHAPLGYVLSASKVKSRTAHRRHGRGKRAGRKATR